MKKMPRKGSQPATRAQLAKVQKDLQTQIRSLDLRVGSLDSKVDRVAVQVAKNTDRFGEVEDRLCAEMSRQTSRIMNVLDFIKGKIIDLDRSQVLTNHRLGRLEARAS